MDMKDTAVSAYDAVLHELRAVANIMELPDATVRFLETPQRIMAATLPVRMDDGSIQCFMGYRSQHNHALGPSRGGTRLHHGETMDDIKALSFWMTIKNSLAGIPCGGGKGGIAVDPASLSSSELERLCRAYVQAIYPVLNPDMDVAGPDMGTPPQVMAWFMDEYERLSGKHVPSGFTGKPILLGGSQGRAQSTGFALVHSAAEFLRHHNQTLEGKTVAIQGFGNLGSNAADVFVQQGAKVIAVSDVFGGIHNAKGIDIPAAIALLQKAGTIKDMPGCDKIDNASLLTLECDILVPAALQNQLTAENARQIRARCIVEGANGPTTPDAEQIILDRGIPLLPDIIANAGGVTTSYLENVQNRTTLYWSAEEVLSRLKTNTIQVCANVCAVAAEKNLPMRKAAWVLALDKVVQAMKLRGWIS
jgi:glutamate dehydrogenase/leucine dehydrogenase